MKKKSKFALLHCHFAKNELNNIKITKMEIEEKKWHVGFAGRWS